jgi:membrane protease YdiL (CAAX protease family)
MKTAIQKFVRWQPSRETLFALLAGILVLGFSAGMTFFKSAAPVQIALRDAGQIFFAGILLPLWIMRRFGISFADCGLSARKWKTFLPINLVLAGGLLAMFLAEAPIPPGYPIDGSTLWKTGYVLLALCFEVFFFHAFLRTVLERAFGILPAIVLTAGFYSLHHMGFQPEYGKLFLIGLLYASVYRLGNSVLLVFPFFYMVGGLYDVLFQSQSVAPILYPEIRALALLGAILATAVVFPRPSNIKDSSRRPPK